MTRPAGRSCDDDRAERFMRLLKGCERRLNGYVLAMAPTWTDADDILQEVVVRLWRQFDEYRPGTDFGAWACTIAHYEVLSHRKREGRRRVRFGKAFAQAVLDEIHAVAESAGPYLDALRGCLEKLEERQRTFLRSYYGSTASVADLSRQSGRGVASIYKDLANLRRGLRLCVERTLREEAKL